MVRFLACLMMVAIGTTSTSAGAANLDDRSLCTIVVKAMDTENREMLADIKQYVLNVMEKLDAGHTEAGEPGIMASLTDNGSLNMVALTAVHCQKFPKQTIFNASAFVYRGTRDMQKQLGTAK